MEITDWSKLEGRRIGKYILEKRLPTGSYGAPFIAYDESLGARRVVKILKGVATDELWREEPKKAARIKNCPYIVLPMEIISEDMALEDGIYHARAIVWEYIDDNATTLKNYLEQPSNITADIILEICRMLCVAIQSMIDADMQHGDLHTGNIMLIPPSSYDPRGRYLIKVIDFGLSASLRGKTSSDVESLGKILQELWEKSNEYEGEVILGDKKFLHNLPALISRILDPNPERRLKDPIKIIHMIEEFREEPAFPDGKQRKLEDPFDYLSAEEMPEESDLVSDLYTDSLPWFKLILSSGTMLISGIRGCGKSMVLRNMRLKTKLVSEVKRKGINEDAFLGFYLHSNHSLNIPFGGKNIKASDMDADLMLHYFNLLYTHEIVDSLRLYERGFGSRFSEVSKKALFDYVTKYFEQAPILLDTTDTLEGLKTALEREAKLVEIFMIKKQKVKTFTGVDYLLNLCGLLKQNFPMFENRKVYFLLDDYSDARGINEHIQRSLNRVIGIRNDKFCFKITTERFAFIPEDLDGNKLEQGREYEYYDLSQRFITHPEKGEEEEFVRTLINKRLSRAGIQGDIKAFLGDYKPPDGDFGRSLGKEETFLAKTVSKPRDTRPANEGDITDFLESYKPPSLRNEEVVKSYKSKLAPTDEVEEKTHYAGFEIVVGLCTGDINALLELCRAIWSEAGGKKALSEPIDENDFFKLQDRVVTRFSRERLALLRGMPEVGDQLYSVACAMGEVSHDKLTKYEPILDSKTGKPRYREVIRINVDEKKSLSHDAEKRYRALVKYGVFTDTGSKYLWGSEVEGIKLVFRKIYTPCFRISYRDRTGLRLTVAELEGLLTEPEKFARRKILDEDDIQSKLPAGFSTKGGPIS